MIAIGAILTVAALDHVENIFAPMVLALTAGIVLSPMTDFWEKSGLSPIFGAMFGLIFTLGVVAALGLVFQPIIAQMVDQAPKVWADMQTTIETVRGLMRGLSEVSDDVSNAIVPEANAAPAAASSDSVALPSVTDALMVAPVVVSQVLVFAGTLFFFLLTRKQIYEWVASHLAPKTERARLAQRLSEAERHVARYFLTITMINAGLGVATAAVLQLMGLPGAMLWGILAFLMNFVLYLGPAVFATALLFAGVAAFDGGMALAPAACYLAINATEAQFVTPALVGRHMALNPLLVFLSLIFGIWLWGPIGGIVAIPLLLWVLVLNDGLHIKAEPTAAAETPAE